MPSGTNLRSGYTMLELVVSLTVLSVMLSSLGLAVNLIVASHPEHTAARDESVEGAIVSLAVGDDIRWAKSLSVRESHAIEFTVDDRDGDGVDEKIHYQWSGDAGAPLRYRYNSGETVDVLDDVHAFEIEYYETTTQVQPFGEDLAVIKAHDDAPGGHFHDFRLAEDDWCGQYFLPSLPDGVSEYKIKRIRIMAGRDGVSDGAFEVRITRAGGDRRPTNEVLESVTVLEEALDTTYQWIDVDLTSLNALDPDEPLCLVIAQTNGSDHAAKIPYNHQGDTMTPSCHYITSHDAGITWSGHVDDKDLRFQVLGTYENHEATPYTYLSKVSTRLRYGTDPEDEIFTSVRLQNAPGVSP